MTIRLELVMDKCMSPNEPTCFNGRMFVDVLVAVNEVIDFTKRYKKVCFIFRVDFGKACDLVIWSFLEYMLIRFVLIRSVCFG